MTAEHWVLVKYGYESHNLVFSYNINFRRIVLETKIDSPTSQDCAATFPGDLQGTKKQADENTGWGGTSRSLDWLFLDLKLFCLLELWGSKIELGINWPEKYLENYFLPMGFDAFWWGGPFWSPNPGPRKLWAQILQYPVHLPPRARRFQDIKYEWFWWKYKSQHIR